MVLEKLDTKSEIQKYMWKIDKCFIDRIIKIRVKLKKIHKQK